MTIKRKFVTYKQGTEVTNSELIGEIVTYDVETAAFLAHRRTGLSFIMVYDELTGLFYHCVHSESNMPGPWEVDIIGTSKLPPHKDTYTIADEDAVEIAVMLECGNTYLHEVLSDHDIKLVPLNTCNIGVYVGNRIVLTQTPSQVRKGEAKLRMHKDLYAALDYDLLMLQLPFCI